MDEGAAAESPPEGWYIDTRRFCERGEVHSAMLGPDRLARLAEEAVVPFNPFSIAVQPMVSPHGMQGMRMRLTGTISLECQRCMEQVVLPIESEAFFEFVDSAAALEADDDDQWDRVMHDARFDLLHLAEDELLLALPYSAKHPACEPSGRQSAGEKAMPFAGLAAMRGARQR